MNNLLEKGIKERVNSLRKKTKSKSPSKRDKSLKKQGTVALSGKEMKEKREQKKKQDAITNRLYAAVHRFNSTCGHCRALAAAKGVDIKVYRSITLRPQNKKRIPTPDP